MVLWRRSPAVLRMDPRPQEPAGHGGLIQGKGRPKTQGNNVKHLTLCFPNKKKNKKYPLNITFLNSGKK